MLYKVSSKNGNVHLWAFLNFKLEVNAITKDYKLKCKNIVDYVIYEVKEEIPNKIFNKYGLKGQLMKGS